MHQVKYWQYSHFYHSGDEYYSSLLACIHRAQRSITIESYIFAYDKLTLLILLELGHAVKRGCEVKLLIDGFGSYYWLPRLEKECSRLGINLRIYHPLPNGFRWFKSIFRYFSFRTFRFFRKMNRRNHRKISIIDEKIAFVGSLNFTQLHSESIMGDLAWRDSGVEVSGYPVKFLVQSFHNSWFRAKKFRWTRFRWKKIKNKIYDPSKSLVRLNTNRTMRWRLYRDLVRKIRQSKNHILVTTAYFIPRRSLVRSLMKASQRGVRVEIILPGVSDAPVVKWAAYGITRRLAEAGIRIYEYQNRVLHAKYMIIDEWTSLGSLNLNHRSFMHDLEVETVFTDSKSVENLMIQWETDRRNSMITNEERFRAASWIKKTLSRLFFRLRYFL